MNTGRRVMAVLAASVGSVGLLAGASGTANAANPVAAYILTPTPIAATGILHEGETVAVTATANDASGSPVKFATGYVAFTPTRGGGFAKSHGVALTSTPVALRFNSSGQLRIYYHAATAPRPTRGSDTISVANSATSPTVTAQTTYTYSSNDTRVTSIALTPTPIAKKGTLAARTKITITLTANGATGPVSAAFIYLTFRPVANGGIAFAHGHSLTGTPTLYRANKSGQVVITYETPATPPTTGTDKIRAQNGPTRPTVIVRDFYTF